MRTWSRRAVVRWPGLQCWRLRDGQLSERCSSPGGGPVAGPALLAAAGRAALSGGLPRLLCAQAAGWGALPVAVVGPLLTSTAGSRWRGILGQQRAVTHFAVYSVGGCPNGESAGREQLSAHSYWSFGQSSLKTLFDFISRCR